MTSAEKQSVVSLLINIANRLESRVNFLHFRSTTQQELDKQGEMKSKILQMAIDTHINHQKRSDAIIEIWLNTVETDLAALAHSVDSETVDFLREVHGRFRGSFLGEPPQAIAWQVTQGDDMDLLSLQAFASFLETEAITLNILAEANKLELEVSEQRAMLGLYYVVLGRRYVRGTNTEGAATGFIHSGLSSDLSESGRIDDDSIAKKEAAYLKAKKELYLKVEEALPHLEILGELTQFIAETTSDNSQASSQARQVLHMLVRDGLSYAKCTLKRLSEKTTVGKKNSIPEEEKYDLRLLVEKAYQR